MGTMVYFYMKKIFGIIFLYLFLSVNSYAATKFTHLSCKQIIIENRATGTFNSDDRPDLSVGSYNGHIFYKFKDVKKKTTFTIYEQGMMVDRDWKNEKPRQTGKEKFEYDDNIYSWADKLEGLEVGYAIENINDEYHQSMLLKMNKDIDLRMDSKCEIVNKKTFKKLIKTGVN